MRRTFGGSATESCGCHELWLVGSKLMTARLEIRDVSYGYGTRDLVLSGATLSLDTHMVCAVLGPNGAGKSTLARLAAGVFQPKTGTVTVGGEDLARAAAARRARLVRVSFQTPEHELFRPTLGAEIEWEARLLGADASVMRSRTTEMLEACGATVPLDKHPYDLDPWQRKLFSCVAALAVARRLVILDEPTLRLGQLVRARLGEALRAYAAEGGAVMFVTHDHEFAASICQTIAIVKRGKIERFGPAGAVLADAAGHAATNIYSFPSYFLDQAVRRRSKLPAVNSRDLQA
jgi:energy-coupling factor transporter ATP-binding protein EcfA2